MNADQIRYMHTMGIQPWELKNKQKNCETSPIATLETTTSTSWDMLQQTVASCTACGLDKTRTQTVFGVGNRNAELMIIGEAPGMHEDKQGEPFVGRAGLLLNAMLESIGFDRNSVYIANILKCRPPNNRDPQVAEVDLCTPFLAKQIALINPKLLLAVGRIAAHFLLDTKTPLGQLRGKLHRYGQLNTPLIITYHPAYLLRTPSEKRKAYQDLLMTRQALLDL